jgi:hypothetical protein
MQREYTILLDDGRIDEKSWICCERDIVSVKQVSTGFAGRCLGTTSGGGNCIQPIKQTKDGYMFNSQLHLFGVVSFLEAKTRRPVRALRVIPYMSNKVIVSSVEEGDDASPFATDAEDESDCAQCPSGDTGNEDSVGAGTDARPLAGLFAHLFAAFVFCLRVLYWTMQLCTTVLFVVSVYSVVWGVPAMFSPVVVDLPLFHLTGLLYDCLFGTCYASEEQYASYNATT